MKHIFDILIQSISLIWKLLTNTTLAWDEIVKEKSSERDTVMHFAVPSIVLCIIFSGFFSFIYADNNNFAIGIITGLVSAISLAGGNYIAYKIGWWGLTKYQPKFAVKLNLVKLIIYSYSIIYVLKAFTALIPSLFFLKVLSVFTAYLVWDGCRAVMGMDEDERGNFVLTMTVVIVFTPLIIRYIFEWMLPNI